MDSPQTAAREADVGQRQHADASADGCMHNAVSEVDANTTVDVGRHGDADSVSTWDYGRHCGLCQNYLSTPPLEFCKMLFQFHDPPSTTSEDNFPDCPFIIVPDALTSERLQCPKDALLLLQELVVFDENLKEDDKVPARKARLRLELPLLLSDPEMDLRHFCRDEQFDYRLTKSAMEDINVEEDEGLQWPARYMDLPAHVFQSIESEKINGTLDGLYYLQNLERPQATAKELQDFREEHMLEHKKVEKVSPITPPLLPQMSPTLPPFDPSSDTAVIPMLSDDERSLAEELEMLEQTFAADDKIQPTGSMHVNATTDLDDIVFDDRQVPCQQGSRGQSLTSLLIVRSIEDSDSSLTRTSMSRKRKRLDFAFDTPLILSDVSSASTSGKKAKNVSFAEQLQSIIPDRDGIMTSKEVAGSQGSDSVYDSFFREVIEPGAMAALRTIEQEQLHSADSLQRLELPVMDFSLPAPPWHNAVSSRKVHGKILSNMTGSHQRDITIQMDTTLLPEYQPLQVTGKENRQMSYVAFDSKLGVVPLEDPIDDARYMAVIMSDLSLEDVVTSDQLVWKLEGIRCLREEGFPEDEEDLVPIEDTEHDFEAGVGDSIEDLAHKRQMSLETSVRRSTGHVLVNQHQPLTIDDPISRPAEIHRDSEDQSTMFSKQTGTRSLLSAFMGNMGHRGKRGLETLSEGHPKSTKASLQEQIRRIPTSTIVMEEEEQLPRRIPSFKDTFNSPLATQSAPSSQTSVLLSADLLRTHRPVLKETFKVHCPNTSLIERDFRALPGAPEADIILSPGTGLVLTFLQQIRQKPLPGQDRLLSGIKERIARIARRYEMLVVLVGNGIKSDAEALDAQDCESIAEFSAFVATLKTDVRVHLLPSGDVSLALWIAACVRDYASNLRLLSDETMWEHFLRRAGFNAYAAQAIVSELKAPDDVALIDPSSSSDIPIQQPFGIRALVLMTPEERLAKFGNLMGGQRVLRRVNRVLEQQWLSAKNDFRLLR